MVNITNFSGIRQWYYQGCNEFGWFSTSDSEHHLFGSQSPKSIYIKICADLFGSQYTESFIEENIAKTNEYFGGRSPDVKNIILTRGEFDITKDLGHEQEDKVFVISS